VALRPWARRMHSEVDQLPQTLATLREAAGDIRQVASDLTVVTARLRQVTDALDAAGLAEATTVIQRSGEAMRASAAGMEAAQSAFTEINDALLGGLAKLPGADLLNPFRRPR